MWTSAKALCCVKEARDKGIHSLRCIYYKLQQPERENTGLGYLTLHMAHPGLLGPVALSPELHKDHPWNSPIPQYYLGPRSTSRTALHPQPHSDLQAPRPRHLQDYLRAKELSAQNGHSWWDSGRNFPMTPLSWKPWEKVLCLHCHNNYNSYNIWQLKYLNCFTSFDSFLEIHMHLLVCKFCPI